MMKVRILKALTIAALCCLTLGVVTPVWAYFNNFESPVGPEWSTNQRDVTPIGGRWFLGQFASGVDGSIGTATLTLPGVAAGNIDVDFDLFIIRSWDGYPGGGPDEFDFGVNGSPLFRTTFSGYLGDTEPKQNYPDEIGGALHFTGTGAVEIDTLGFDWSGVPRNYVYHLAFNFPHPGGDLSIYFQGVNLQGWSGGQNAWNESWGIDNVNVVPEPGSLFMLGMGGLGLLLRCRRK
jgi:hypothetical protein